MGHELRDMAIRFRSIADTRAKSMTEESFSRQHESNDSVNWKRHVIFLIFLRWPPAIEKNNV